MIPFIFFFLFFCNYGNIYGQNTSNTNINTEIHSTKEVPWIGIDYVNLTKGISNIAGLGEREGILITTVYPQSPAEKAGLNGGNESVDFGNGQKVSLGGDIILKADNQTIHNINNFTNILNKKEKGEKIHLGIFHNGQIKPHDVIVGSKLIDYYYEPYSNPNKIGFSKYYNLNSEIEMRYPTTWTKEDNNETNDNTTITFRSPYENSNDTAKEYVKIYVSPSLSHADLSNKAIATNEHSGWDDPITINEHPKELHIITANDIILSDSNASRIVYNFTDDKFGPVKAMKIATQKNNKVYLITFFAQESKFNTYLPTIKNMINSFVIVPYKTYENLDKGIRTDYPSTWNITEKKESFIQPIYRPGGLGSGVTFSPNPNNYSNGLGKLEVFVSLPNEKKSINEDMTKILDYYKNLKKPLFHLVNFIYPTKNHQTFYNVTYSYGDKDVGIIISSRILTSINDRLYSFSYSIPKENYSGVSPIMKKIIDSTEFFTKLELIKQGLGLTLQYPSDWEKEDIDNNSIDIYDPKQRSGLHDRSNLIITLSNATDTIDNNFSNKEYKNTSLKTTNEVSLPAKTKNITFEDKDRSSNGNNDLKGMQILVPLINKVDNTTHLYNFTFIANKDQYYKQIKTIENIISSVKIIDYQPVSKNFSNFTSPNYGYTIHYPSDWQYTFTKPGEAIFKSNITNYNDNLSPPLIKILVRPLENSTISEIIEGDIAYLINNFKEFKLIDSRNVDENHNRMYETTHTDGKYMTLTRHVLNDNNSNLLYTILYQSPKDIFYDFLPTAERVISSFDVVSNGKVKTYTGFKVGESPFGIAVNSLTNTIYVANQLSNTVSAINGTNDQKITDIRVSTEPMLVSLDTLKNIVYVVHPGILSVIDGRNNTVLSNMPIVAENPLASSINTNTNRLYIADGDTKDILVIDTLKNAVIKKISGINNDTQNAESDSNGIGISVDQIKNKIYAVNGLENKVAVIDGKDNNIIDNISLAYGEIPYDIAVNSYTNKAYIAGTYKFNPGSFISELDLSTPKERPLDVLGTKYSVIALNPLMNKIYATDVESNNVLSYDLLQNHKTILPVDSRPMSVAINTNTNIIFVSNSGSDTISKIDGSTNKILFGLKFQIEPADSATILCKDSNNTMKISNGDYKTFTNGTYLKCNEEPKNPFSPLLSSSWSGINLTSPKEFYVNQYGIVGGTFDDLTSFIQRIGTPVSIFILLLVVVAATIPSIITKLGIAAQAIREPIFTKTEIIGIDASIIVGILFFLTITEGFSTSQQRQITIITANIILPFAISAIMTMTNKDRFAIRLIMAGFINLIISVMLISIMRTE